MEEDEKMNFSIFGLQTKVYKAGRTEHSQGKKEKDIKAEGFWKVLLERIGWDFWGKLVEKFYYFYIYILLDPMKKHIVFTV